MIQQKLSLAENLMILDGARIKGEKLIKMIIMNLLINKVLKIITVQKRAHKNAAISKTKYVCRCENFNQSQLQEFEQYFINPFIEKII